MDSSKFQILSEHYVHTFDLLQRSLRNRDNLFLGLLFILAVMLFQIYSPSIASNIISELVGNQLDTNANINFDYIQSIIWFSLLAVVVKYFQSVFFIERQYDYIHSLEVTLSFDYEGVEFTREGKSYLNSYPIFLDWMSFLYTILVPVILALVISAKIFTEYQGFFLNGVLFWFNLLIYFFIFISLCLYLYGIHFKSKSA